MSLPTSAQIGALLEAAGPGSTVYLVGIGGCGMSGLGHLVLDLGLRVAGSDLAANAETRQLRERGAIIHLGHAAEQVAAAQPVLLVYTPAVRRDNPELQQAERMEIPIVRRAVLLAALLHRQRGIAVAGMHGKTTTSALLAFALENLTANPSYAIGARVPQLGRHARLAQPAGDAVPPWFVIEADESDGGLREFHPECAMVLNVDEEHVDFYADLDAVCAEFERFGLQTRGPLVFCADDARLRELFADRPNTISYGFHPASQYRLMLNDPAVPPHDREQHRETFAVWHRGENLGAFRLRLCGEKNVSNAGGVIALLHHLGYSAPAIARAIAPFGGAARRQHELFRDARFRVFDDYGHHPAEIEATLELLKRMGCGRLLVAFQPHRYTRTRALLGQFANCFETADRLWVTEIYPASEPPIPGVTGALLAETVRARGQPVEFIGDLGALRRAVRAAMRPGDAVLFLGAGDITQAAHELAGDLRAEASPG